MDDSDDDIVVLEEIRPKGSDSNSKNWKWKAPNPICRVGATDDILAEVRAKLNMQNPVITINDDVNLSTLPSKKNKLSLSKKPAKERKSSTSILASDQRGVSKQSSSTACTQEPQVLLNHVLTTNNDGDSSTLPAINDNISSEKPTKERKVSSSIVPSSQREVSKQPSTACTEEPQVLRTPTKSASTETPISLTPQEILELTDNCLDSDNEPDMTPFKAPLASSPPTKAPKRALSFNFKASSSVQNRASRFFGAGTSSEDVQEILATDDGSQSKFRSPSKSPSPKKKRLSKNSPIRQLPSHRNLGKSPGKRSPVKRVSESFSPNKTISPNSKNSSNHDVEDEVLPGGPYYCEAFCHIIKKVYEHAGYHHLFLEPELNKMREINSSKREYLLYVRLMNRKDKWNRTSDISYNDIAPELSSLFDILESQEFISCDVSEEKLDDLLNLLKVDELKDLCSTYKVKKTGNKPDIVNALLTMYKTQPTLAGVSPLLKSVKHVLGRCVRLKNEWRLVFRRCILLFSMFHCHEDLDQLSSVQALLLLQVKLGNMVFPLQNAKIPPTAQVFASRDQLIRYEEAKVLNQELHFAMEMKNFKLAEELTNKCMKQFATLLELTSETNHVAGLPPFLQKFCAGSCYSYTLTKSVEAMKQNKKFHFALVILNVLLDQETYCLHYRGRWALMKASLLHINLKDISKAYKVLFSALKDRKNLSPVDCMHLQQRAEKVVKLKKNGLTEKYKNKLKSVMDPPFKPPQTVEICARAFLGSKAGLKKVYIRDTENGKEFMSVEETVIAHYRDLGFKYGVHDEGSSVASLCLLSLWIYIYDVSVPSVFQSAYQDKPLDWGSKGFYETRKDALEARFLNLLSRDVKSIAEELYDLQQNYSHTTSVVNWDRLANLDFHAFLDCISIPVFVAISRRLVQDWKSNRSGFPDLILWCPPQKKCLFIEVKSPNDTLSTVQYLWLNFLQNCKANALVAHIRETGSKSSGVGQTK